MAQKKSEQWPLMRPVQQLRRPPGLYSRQRRMLSRRDGLKSRNRLPASKRRLDVPQSARLAGAAVQPADANVPQDGQLLAEGRREKDQQQNARQNADCDSFMPQTAAQRLQTSGKPRMASASGEFNPLRGARSQKGLLDVAGGAWQDLGDLIQAELELFRAEISEKLTLTVWSASLIGAGVVLLVATLVLLLQAAIGALVVLGVSWLAAICIVAVVTLMLGGSLVWLGFNNLAHRLTPTKSVAQVQKDAKALTGSR